MLPLSHDSQGIVPHNLLIQMCLPIRTCFFLLSCSFAVGAHFLLKWVISQSKLELAISSLDWRARQWPFIISVTNWFPTVKNSGPALIIVQLSYHNVIVVALRNIRKQHYYSLSILYFSFLYFFFRLNNPKREWFADNPTLFPIEVICALCGLICWL